MKKVQMNSWVLVVLALMLMLCSTSDLAAQDVTATVTGTVMDSSGAALVGATVTVKSVERGAVYTATTNESGIYRVSQLPVGTYEVKVRKGRILLSSLSGLHALQ